MSTVVGMGTAIDGHHAWVAYLFTDGAFGRGWLDGPIATTGGADLVGPPCQRRSPDDISGWQAVCDCGCWRGPVWTRVAHPDDHDLAARQIHCPSGRVSADLECRLLAEWSGHHETVEAMYPVQLAYDSLREAEQRLAEAVRFVRAGGASWEEIGRSAGGVPARAARHRWGVLGTESQDDTAPMGRVVVL